MATSAQHRRSRPPKPATEAKEQTGAYDVVVCLAAGLSPDGKSLSNSSLANVGKACQLIQERNGRILVVSGGLTVGDGPTEAELMASLALEILGQRNRFGLLPETDSRTTHSQAVLLKKLLTHNLEHGGVEYRVRSATLVCQPVHMERVYATFHKEWPELIFGVSTAEEAFGNCSQRRWNSKRLAEFWNWLGLWYYRVRGWA